MQILLNNKKRNQLLDYVRGKIDVLDQSLRLRKEYYAGAAKVYNSIPPKYLEKMYYSGEITKPIPPDMTEFENLIKLETYLMVNFGDVIIDEGDILNLGGWNNGCTTDNVADALLNLEDNLPEIYNLKTAKKK